MQLTRPYGMTEDAARQAGLLRQEFFAGVTTDDVKDQMTRRLHDTQDESLVRRTKVGRNHACPCGSGRKFKRCCISELRAR